MSLSYTSPWSCRNQAGGGGWGSRAVILALRHTTSPSQHGGPFPFNACAASDTRCRDMGKDTGKRAVPGWRGMSFLLMIGLSGYWVSQSSVWIPRKTLSSKSSGLVGSAPSQERWNSTGGSLGNSWCGSGCIRPTFIPSSTSSWYLQSAKQHAQKGRSKQTLFKVNASTIMQGRYVSNGMNSPAQQSDKFIDENQMADPCVPRAGASNDFMSYAKFLSLGQDAESQGST
jgi:hypothetical protein